MTNKQEVEEFCKEHSLTEQQFYGREKIEGNLDLSSLTSIPDGFSPIVGRHLFLNGLTSISEGFNPIVGGSLILNGLTSIPKWFNPVIGNDLRLNGIKHIPKGFNPTVGHDLWLDSLTAIPEGFNPTVGNVLWLDGIKLASVPKWFNPPVTQIWWMCCYELPKNKPVYPITWRDGKYMLVDDLLCEVLEREEDVFKVKVVSRTDVSYVVKSGASWSHGETLEEVEEKLPER